MVKHEIINRILEKFPAELLQLEQWVLWRIEIRDGNPTKVPYTVNGFRAASDEPSTWTSFEKAAAAFAAGNYEGVGFMFSEHDPYCGVDFDKCIENGVIDPAKLDWITDLDSYSERSPTGTGVHTILIGRLNGGGRKNKNLGIEIYDRRRFFTVTGDRLGDFPTKPLDRQEELDRLYNFAFPPKPKGKPKATTVPTGEIPQDDQQLLDRMFASRNGAKIRALWGGSTAMHGNDESAADQALCNYLAWWTAKDEERMDRMFRQSGRMRDKWDRNARSGETYGQGTIRKAIEDLADVYQGVSTYTNGTNGHTNGHANGAGYAKGSDMDEDKAPQAQNADDSYLLTEGAHDKGNAQCVYKRTNGAFLHSETLGWLRYTGTHWTMDEAESAAERAITETLIARVNACMRAGVDQYGELLKRVVPNHGKVSGAKNQLKSFVSISDKAFDTDPDHLNCLNGVVDLRTGEMKPHSPEQRFMHCTTVPYDPTVDQAPWINWLIETVGSQETADWLQMAVGYSLTGHTSEEILFYLYGPPRSGKGTFTETLLALLGSPLAKEVNFATFTAQRTGDSQNFDLAPLKPCRFVAASESNSYERFNEAKVKALTGGNEVYCAYKHQNHFNYRPQFKIWLSSNQPVNADPDDDAVWGRLRVVEFPFSHLGEENKALKAAMRSPEMLQAVLAWAIEGAQAWYLLGPSGLPELTTSATKKAEQRAELDNVQAWLDERCELGEHHFSANGELYPNYAEWCKSNGVVAKQQKSFSQSLKRKGFADKVVKQNGKATRGFTGVRVL